MGLGDAYRAKKQFDKAQSFYRKSLDRAISVAEKYQVLVRTGMAWEQAGSSAKAVHAYQKALDLTQDAAQKEKLTRTIAELGLRRR